MKGERTANSEQVLPYSSSGSGGGSGEESFPKYKGVRKRKWGKWVSEVRLPNSRERIWLGSYDTAEKAARAFDAAKFCLRGRHAQFNFPDSPPPDIPGAGRSLLSPQEIQVVAARFAEQQDHRQHNINHEDHITDDKSSCSIQEPPAENPNNFPPLLSDPYHQQYHQHGHVMSTNDNYSNNNTDSWSFLNFNLDYSAHDIGGSGYDNFDDQIQYPLFCGQMHSGEFSADFPVLPADADNITNENIVVNGDHELLLSQQYSSSFLWNF